MGQQDSPEGSLERSLHITGEYLVGQFRQLLPQVHLTLISVLQSFALGALLVFFDPPRHFDPSGLASDIAQHAFYLPQIASFLIIVTVWNEYVFAVFSVPWPLTSINTAIQFLFIIPEFAALSSVNHVAVWVFWVGVIGIFGAIIRVRNSVIVSKELYRQVSETEGMPVLWKGRNAPYLVPEYWVPGLVFVALGYWWETTPRLFTGTVVKLPGTLPISLAQMLAVGLPFLVIVVLLYSMHADDRAFGRHINEFFAAYHVPYKIERRRLEPIAPTAPAPVHAGAPGDSPRRGEDGA